MTAAAQFVDGLQQRLPKLLLGQFGVLRGGQTGLQFAIIRGGQPGLKTEPEALAG